MPHAKDVPMTSTSGTAHEAESVTATAPHRRHARALRGSAVGVGILSIAGGGLFAVTPAALAASSAPTHGTTTCAAAGDECTTAINYAKVNDGGGATVLAVEADTDAHGGGVTHRVFDIRMQTHNGVYDIHVYRNDNTPYRDAVWWQNLAEHQHRGGISGSGSGEPDGGGVTGSNSPRISASQAAKDATNYVIGQRRQVLSVKHNQLKDHGPKVYYQVKLQLGGNGRNAGTTNVWVDATSSPGTVTAVSGSRLNYRDPNLISTSTAEANALKAVGGGSVYKESLNGGKWRWYWVFLRDGSTKYKVGLDAVTGSVTYMRRS